MHDEHAPVEQFYGRRAAGYLRDTVHVKSLRTGDDRMAFDALRDRRCRLMDIDMDSMCRDATGLIDGSH